MSLCLAPAPGIAIAGSGTAFPSDLEGLDPGEHRLTNRDVYQLLLGDDFAIELARRGWSLEHVERDLGIRERQWIRGRARAESPMRRDAGDLALHAARKALEDAQVRAHDIDLIVLATSTPPRITSSLAHRVAAELGTNAACLDVRAGGAGGLHAWSVAASWLMQGARRALVVATETPSMYLDARDLASALVYGDGAAALVLVRDESAASGMFGAWLGSLAPRGTSFTVPGPLPPTRAAIDAGAYSFRACDAEYRGLLTATWQRVGLELTQHATELGIAIDLFVPYSVTRAQVELAAKSACVPIERTIIDLATRGCLGSAGVLAALDRVRRESRLRAGDVLALGAVAGGIASASILWKA